MTTCGKVWKLRSHMLLLLSLPSTSAVSLVLRIEAHFLHMPFASTLQCAYVDATGKQCKKTTDKRAFGHVNRLSPSQLSSYSSWLKPQHDGVVCNCHYTLLRRLLTKQSLAQEESSARMDALLSAPGERTARDHRSQRAQALLRVARGQDVNVASNGRHQQARGRTQAHETKACREDLTREARGITIDRDFSQFRRF